MADVPPENLNPFQSPASSDALPTAPSTPSGSKLGDILGRAFNSYFQQWSEWPIPVLLCGLIFIGCELACFVPMLFALGPIMCALFACAFRNLRGGPVDTAALGRGWQVFWPATWSGMAIILIQLAPMFLMAIVLFGGMAAFSANVAPGRKPDDATVLTFMFGMVAGYAVLIFSMLIWGIYFSTRTMFVLPLVADRGYGFAAAWHLSWKATRRRFWERVLLVVLGGVLANLGANLCYVGLLFTAPIYFLIVAAAYDDEFGISFEGWQAPVATPGAASESPFGAQR